MNNMYQKLIDSMIDMLDYQGVVEDYPWAIVRRYRITGLDPHKFVRVFDRVLGRALDTDHNARFYMHRLELVNGRWEIIIAEF